MEDFDVVVAGAGPAGSAAARFASEGGARTLLLEKRDIVGVPFECGEFLPSPSTLREIMPDAEDVEGLFDIPASCISRMLSKMAVVSPAGKRYVLDFDGLSLYREKYDQHLAGLAEKAGAVLRVRTRVSGVKGDVVETDAGPVRARVVVGADGPLSTVRRSAMMSGPRLQCPCLQYTVPGDFGDTVEMYFGRVAPGGYAWVIPKKDGGNIGLGLPPMKKGRTLRERLDSFMAERGVSAKPSLETSGIVPASGPVRETVSGNVLLVGDAAGQVMASNGGGIPIAVVCGRAAGRAAAAFVKGKGPLSDYERMWRTEVGEVLVNSLHTKNLADWWMWSDALVGLAMLLIGEGGIRKALTCKKILGFY
jgi:digeranylgeranylglycerophospholipid reductase